MNLVEEFHVIKDHENYEVSNLGNIRNTKTGRILKPHVTNGGYCNVSLNRKLKLIHQLVAKSFLENPNNLEVVDHINNDKTDNSVNNLRYATIQQNCRNKILSSNNTSGYKGVSWYKPLHKWKASITIDKKKNHIGYFCTIEEALNARLKAVEQHFGDFANKNEKDLIINLNINNSKNKNKNAIINVNMN